jgi:hypothetical protein
MERNINEIEDALFQVKNLEESLKKNAQGILSSTMKEEISSLVKESLKKEVDEEDVEDDTDDESDDTDNTMDDMEGSTEDDVIDDIDYEEDDSITEPPVTPEDGDVETIDLRGEKNMDNVMRVWMSMDPNDGIIVTKDDEMINLSDKNTGKEYMISLNESEDFFGDPNEEDPFEDDEYDPNYDEYESLGIPDDMPSYKTKWHSDEDELTGFEDNEDGDYDPFEDVDYSQLEEMMGELGNSKKRREDDIMYELELNDKSEFMEDSDSDLFGDEYSEFMKDYDSDDDLMGGETLEDYDLEVDQSIFEAKKMSAKPKGVTGHGPKFKYGKTNNFEIKKQPTAFGKEGVKAKGTGKAKFEYDEDVNMDGYTEKPTKRTEKPTKRKEFKEASRTLGNGSNFRKGGLPKPRAHSKANTAINEELQLMREKNEEYRKALNLFRNKLNEVAVFNSNLAYVTRLFTEHSTTKQEKINILRRFDNIETIKESKNLYKVIKSELGSGQKSQQTIKESVQRSVERTPSTGSAVNLIESKTYENPQFLRMKDLMKKI